MATAKGECWRPVGRMLSKVSSVILLPINRWIWLNNSVASVIRNSRISRGLPWPHLVATYLISRISKLQIDGPIADSGSGFVCAEGSDKSPGNWWALFRRTQGPGFCIPRQIIPSTNGYKYSLRNQNLHQFVVHLVQSELPCTIDQGLNEFLEQCWPKRLGGLSNLLL